MKQPKYYCESCAMPIYTDSKCPATGICFGKLDSNPIKTIPKLGFSLGQKVVVEPPKPAPKMQKKPKSDNKEVVAFDLYGKQIGRFKNCRAAADHFDVMYSTVHIGCNRLVKRPTTMNGLVFKYAEDKEPLKYTVIVHSVNGKEIGRYVNIYQAESGADIAYYSIDHAIKNNSRRLKNGVRFDLLDIEV
jgi:hypothetical protein